MGNHSETSVKSILPPDFFTGATFGTCSGCATVTWIVTCVLSGLFHINPGITGLIVAMIVAFAGLFLSSSPREKKQYIITFFNGFLIYATVVGVTSFLPYVNQQTATIVQETKPGLKGTLKRPWIYDRNLVSATKDLISIQQKQASTINKLDKTITTMESSLTRESMPTAESRTRMLSQLSESKNAIESTKAEIKPKISSLERFGLRRQ